MECHCDDHSAKVDKDVTEAYHMYRCVFYLNEVENYSYDMFQGDYYRMKAQNIPHEEIWNHFMSIHGRNNKKENQTLASASPPPRAPPSSPSSRLDNAAREWLETKRPILKRVDRTYMDEAFPQYVTDYIMARWHKSSDNGGGTYEKR